MGEVLEEQKKVVTQPPTIEQFTALQGAYKYFNRVLFQKKLPAVILNLSRKHQAAGFLLRSGGDELKLLKGQRGQYMSYPLIQKYSPCLLSMCIVHWNMSNAIFGNGNMGNHHD